MDAFSRFPFDAAGELAARIIRQAYESSQFAPDGNPQVAAIPEAGEGFPALADAFANVLSGSVRLAAPGMMGHMDTAPHPAGAFMDAVLSALNNNLLFREISPFASRVEELLVKDIGSRLGLSPRWAGTFASGGSIANLTALFAATGGYPGVGERSTCELFLPECAHTSIRKAAAVLGLRREQLKVVAGDELGRSDTESLRAHLASSRAERKIVVGVLGSTIHGAVEDLRRLTSVCKAFGAWLHVDAIHGGALAFSKRHRELLAGLDEADSVAVAPQKWMYVPRVSAIVWVKGDGEFKRLLGLDLPYSQSAELNRGRLGLQGSRRADAVCLWAVLRYIGAGSLGAEIDRTIELTRAFHEMLGTDERLEPTHEPALNLLCFRYRARASAEEMCAVQRNLGIGDVPWVSVSEWRGETVFRAVLLSPRTNESHLRRLIQRLAKSYPQ